MRRKFKGAEGAEGIEVAAEEVKAEEKIKAEEKVEKATVEKVEKATEEKATEEKVAEEKVEEKAELEEDNYDVATDNITSEIMEPFSEGFGREMKPSAEAMEGSLLTRKWDISEVTKLRATKLKGADGATGAIMRALKAGDTSLSLALSESGTVRAMTQDLVHGTESKVGDILGLGKKNPVQLEARSIRDNHLIVYENAVKEALRETKLSKTDFEAELGRAMHKNGKSSFPEVAEVAEILKEKIFDPLLERAQEAGVPVNELYFNPEESYFPRKWSIDAIFEDPEGMTEVVHKGGLARMAKVAEEYDDFKLTQKTMEAQLSAFELDRKTIREDAHLDLILKAMDDNVSRETFIKEYEAKRTEAEARATRDAAQGKKRRLTEAEETLAENTRELRVDRTREIADEARLEAEEARATADDARVESQERDADIAETKAKKEAKKAAEKADILAEKEERKAAKARGERRKKKKRRPTREEKKEERIREQRERKRIKLEASVKRKEKRLTETIARRAEARVERTEARANEAVILRAEAIEAGRGKLTGRKKGELKAKIKENELHAGWKRDQISRIQKSIEHSQDKRELTGVLGELEQELDALEASIESSKGRLEWDALTDVEQSMAHLPGVLQKMKVEEKYLKKELKKTVWSDGQAKQIVSNMTDGMLRDDGLQRTGSGIRRERTLDFISHDLAEPYIDLDVESITRRHLDQMSREIALAERFGEHFSDVRETAHASKINAEMELIAEKNGWDFEKKTKIMSKQLDDINALLQMVRGTFRADSTSGRALKAGERILNGYMHTTKMGTGVFTQMVDFVMPIREIGIRNWLGEVFMQSLEGLEDLGKKLAKGKRSPAFLRDVMHIMHEETSRFAGDLQLQAFQKGKRSFVGNAAAQTYELFQKLSLMRETENAIHNFHGKAMYNYIQRTLKKKFLTRTDIEFFSRHGISKKSLPGLAKRAKAGSQEQFYWRADYSQEQYRLISNAVRMGVDGLSINPKSHVMPKSFQKNMMLRVLSKYKSFLFMLNRRVLISGINNRDAKYLQVMGALFIAESMAKLIKGVIAGRGTPKGEDIVKAGLGGSGMFGVLAPGVDIGDSVVRGKGLEEDLSRVAPAAGTLKDAIIAGNSVLSPKRRGQDLSKQEKRAIKRLVPFNNLSGIGRFWNHLIDGGR